MKPVKERFGFRARGNAFTAFLVGLFLLSIGCTGVGVEKTTESRSAGTKDSTRLAITPTPVEYKRKVTVTFSGSGFQPKQELGIEVEMGGAPSDVSFLMKPRPVPDNKGAFSSKWVLDGEIRRKLLEPKTYTVNVVDANGKVLTSAPLVFKKVEEKAEKKK